MSSLVQRKPPMLARPSFFADMVQPSAFEMPSLRKSFASSSIEYTASYLGTNSNGSTARRSLANDWAIFRRTGTQRAESSDQAEMIVAATQVMRRRCQRHVQGCILPRQISLPL